MSEVAVDVVLPVLNEAGAIPWVLDRMPSGMRAIVVDNGSTDGSGDIARARGATVVEAEMRGFGAACWAGLQHATADVVAFMDCDASLDPTELALVLAPLERGEADLVLGARRPERGAWPLPARLANGYLGHLLQRRGIALHDLGPMRVARRTELLALGIEDRGTGWPLEMVLRADAAGWRIAEVPVHYHPRIGQSKVTGSLAGCARVARQFRRTLRAFPPPVR